MAISIELVRKVGFFKGLEDPVVQTIARMSHVKVFERDEYIFSEGDAPDWFCAVISGKIKIVRHSPSGKDVIIDMLDEGQIFGEVAVYDGGPYPASAVAAEKTDVLRLSRDDFRALIVRYPSLGLNNIEILARRLRNATSTISSLGAEQVQQRIALLLLKFEERLGTKDSSSTPIKLTRQEIAEMTGTTVETAIRILSKLDKNGVTGSERGQINILNRKKLKEISGS